MVGPSRLFGNRHHLITSRRLSAVRSDEEIVDRPGDTVCQVPSVFVHHLVLSGWCLYSLESDVSVSCGDMAHSSSFLTGQAWVGCCPPTQIQLRFSEAESRIGSSPSSRNNIGIGMLNGGTVTTTKDRIYTHILGLGQRTVVVGQGLRRYSLQCLRFYYTSLHFTLLFWT